MPDSRAPMPPAPLELELPEDVDEARFLVLLRESLDVEVGRSTTSDRVLLDTFDTRLRSAGLRAERTRRGTLIVHEPGMPVRRAEVRDAPALGVAALPPGPVRDRLAPVLEERALLHVTRMRSRTVPVAVLNGDGKTVVRLSLVHGTVGGRSTWWCSREQAA